MEQKTGGKKTWLRLAAYALLVVMIISTWMVCGLFARYTNSAQSSDSARVAKFSIDAKVTENGESQSHPITAVLKPGDNQTAVIEVENKSEVAVRYRVDVTNVTKNLPLDISMKKIKEEDGSPEETNGESFTVDELPGEYTDKYKLTIAWPESEGNNALEKMGMVDYIKVTVTAEQTD